MSQLQEHPHTVAVVTAAIIVVFVAFSVPMIAAATQGGMGMQEGGNNLSPPLPPPNGFVGGSAP